MAASTSFFPVRLSSTVPNKPKNIIAAKPPLYRRATSTLLTRLPEVQEIVLETDEPSAGGATEVSPGWSAAEPWENKSKMNRASAGDTDFMDQDNEAIIRVFDMIGSPFAVSSDDGQAVYDRIAPLIRQGRKVRLSFEQIETVIPAFLNAAIGQLYGEFSENTITNLVDVGEISRDDLTLVKQVIDNARLYLKHRIEFDKAWREEIGVSLAEMIEKWVLFNAPCTKPSRRA